MAADPTFRSVKDATFYSVDGNHLGGVNKAGAAEVRTTTARFEPGTTNGLFSGPNARTVSNVVVQGGGDLLGTSLSGNIFAFGQLLDHDLDRTRSDGVNQIGITIPAGDPFFTPGSVMNMTRATLDPATGTQVNAITGWIDMSFVYGSDATQAALLRGDNGRLATSAGNHMPITNGNFVAGDVRANENPKLVAMQELFMREHNRLADLIKADSPTFSSDLIYSMARAINIAQFQHIIYDEYLPAILGTGAPGDYMGFDPNVDPSITQEFAGAAFRWGHTTVSNEVNGIDNNGVVTSTQTLGGAFGQPAAGFIANGGADPQLRHLADQLAQKFDTHLVDGLRNLLADPTSTQDLAALNIQRGRDLGFGSLNDVREDLGLARYSSMAQLTSDAATAAALTAAYGSVDLVELWIGGLAERPVNGGLLGETMATIVGDQFEALRAGDPLWWQNQGFDKKVSAAIQNTSLSDIIVRNTDTKVMQENAFFATDRHASNVAAANPNLPQLVIGVDTNGATIAGGSMDDTIVAGKGLNQILTGGAGEDRFVFLNGGHVVTITDFQPGTDTLDFGADVQFKANPSGKGNSGSIQITADNNTITLTGVSMQALDRKTLLAQHTDV